MSVKISGSFVFLGLMTRRVSAFANVFRAQTIHTQTPGGLQTKLTTQQINHILRLREASSADVDPPAPIKSFEASQLAANFPIEDRCIEAKLLRTGGILFAVIDGHGGPGCAQALSERLADYVSVALMDAEHLQRFAKEMEESLAKKSEVRRAFHNALSSSRPEL